MSGLSILVLTEDSGREGVQVVEAVLRSALKLKTEEYQARSVKCEPADEEYRKVLNANGWESRSARETTALLKSMATRLKRPDGFVVFHYDGDKEWSTKGDSKHKEPFDRVIWNALPNHLVDKPSEAIPKQRSKQPRDRTLPATPTPDPREKLLTMVPFYSIESWLFQNTEEVKKLCQEHHTRKTQTCGTLTTERGELDEILKIKEKCCLKSAYNLDLARDNFPTKEVYDVGKSFKSFADSLRVLVERFDKPYVDSKQEELTTHWKLRDFTADKLPKVRTRKEMDRLLSLLDETLTEDEILQKLV